MLDGMPESLLNLTLLQLREHVLRLRVSGNRSVTACSAKRVGVAVLGEALASDSSTGPGIA